MRHRSTDRLLTLGMALTTDRRAMERRVRGVFARKKSAKGVLALSALLVLALGFAAFTTACQAGQGIWWKDDSGRIHVRSTQEGFERIAAGNASTETSIAIPQNVEQEITGLPEGLRLTIHADVTGLEQDAYPVYLTQRTHLTQAEFDRIALALTGGAELVKINAAGETLPYTVSELTQAKAIYQAELAQPNIDVGDSTWYQHQIDEIDRVIKTAPETHKLESADLKVVRDTLHGTARQSDALFFLPDGSKMKLSACFMQESSSESDYLNVNPGELFGVYPAATPLDNGAAEQAAEQLLTALRFSATKLTLPEGIDGWQFSFGRQYDNIPDAIDLSGGFSAVGGKLRAFEQISMTFYEQGVFDFSWQNMQTPIGCVNQNAPLLSFDEIYQAFIKEARQNELWKSNFKDQNGFVYHNVEMNITGFSLGYAAVACSADDSLRYLIPVWRVIGTVQSTSTTSTTDGAQADETGTPTRERVLLSINAIDGTVLYADDGGASGR